MPSAFIRRLSAHERLSPDETRMLIEACEPTRMIPRHRDLIREGEKPGPLFVILKGWACRYKVLRDGSRQIMAFLLPGDFCDLHVGELDAMDHNIGTITACETTAIARARIDALIVATPALTRAFWRSQLIDEAVLRAWIVSLGRRTSIERVAHLMLELYVRMRTIGLTTGDTCEMPLIQTVLADALGMTPVHVNRVLRELRELGIMKLGSRTLTILDINKLTTIAGFDENYLHRRVKQAA